MAVSLLANTNLSFYNLGSTTVGTASPGMNVTVPANGAIVVCAHYANSSAITLPSAPTDNHSNSYSLLWSGHNAGTTEYMAIYLAVSSAGFTDSAFTVTVQSPVTSMNAHVLVLGGLIGQPQLDGLVDSKFDIAIAAGASLTITRTENTTNQPGIIVNFNACAHTTDTATFSGQTSLGYTNDGSYTEQYAGYSLYSTNASFTESMTWSVLSGKSSTNVQSVGFAICGATVPAAPSGLTLTGGTSGQLALSWTDNSNGGSAVTNHAVEYRVTGTTTWSSPIATGSTATTYTLTGLTDGTSYDVQVAATNVVGTGTYSNIATHTCGTPAASPTNFTVGTTTATSIPLTWSEATGTSTVTSYDIYIQPVPGSSDPTQHNYTVNVPVSGTVVASGSSSYTLTTNIESGSTYNLQIRANNAVVVGSYGGNISATTLTANTVPTVPTGVTATPGDGSANVTWTASTWNGLTYYTVGAYNGTTLVTSVRTKDGITTSVAVPGLTNGTSYTFQVSATNSVGTSANSTASGAITANKQYASSTPSLISGTPAWGHFSATTSCAVTFGAPVPSGSLMICSIRGQNMSTNSVTDNVNGNWTNTQISYNGSGTTNAAQLRVFYKVATTSGTPTVTVSDAVESVETVEIYAFTNATDTTPVYSGSYTSAPPISGSLSSISSNSLLFFQASSDAFYTSTYNFSTTPSGYTTLYNNSGTAGANNDLAGLSAYSVSSSTTASVSVQYPSGPPETDLLFIAFAPVQVLSLPPAPTIGTASYSSGAASVSFTPLASGNTGASAISSYQVTSSGTTNESTGTGTTSPINVPRIGSGTFTFTVLGINAQGPGASSSASNPITTVKNLTTSVGPDTTTTIDNNPLRLFSANRLPQYPESMTTSDAYIRIFSGYRPVSPNTLSTNDIYGGIQSIFRQLIPESLITSDLYKILQSIFRQLNPEALTTTDIYARLQSLFKQLIPEADTTSDLYRGLQSVFRQLIPESLTTSGFYSQLQSIFRQLIPESLTTAAVYSQFQALLRRLTPEAVTTADLIYITKSIFKQLVPETLTTSAIYTGLQSIFRSLIPESITTSDLVKSLQTVIRQITTQTLSTGDAYQRVLSSFRSILPETLSTGDLSSRILNKFNQITPEILTNIVDSLARNAIAFQRFTVAETLSVTDAFARLSTLFRFMTTEDLSSLMSSSVYATKLYFASITQTLTAISDSLTRAAVAIHLPSFIETLSNVSDTISTISTLGRVLTDTLINITDAVGITKNLFMRVPTEILSSIVDSLTRASVAIHLPSIVETLSVANAVPRTLSSLNRMFVDSIPTVNDLVIYTKHIATYIPTEILSAITDSVARLSGVSRFIASENLIASNAILSTLSTLNRMLSNTLVVVNDFLSSTKNIATYIPTQSLATVVDTVMRITALMRSPLAIESLSTIDIIPSTLSTLNRMVTNTLSSIVDAVTRYNNFRIITNDIMPLFVDTPLNYAGTVIESIPLVSDIGKLIRIRFLTILVNDWLPPTIGSILANTIFNRYVTQNVALNPIVSMTNGAGSGPPAPNVLTSSQDGNGTVLFGTGGGAVAGPIVHIRFYTPRNSVPTVTLFSNNATTTSAQVYVANVTNLGFDIALTNVLSNQPNTTYNVQWEAI